MSIRIALALIAFFSIAPAQRLEVPYLTGRVVDLAGILSRETIDTIEAKLAAHEQATSNQVAVLIIPSLQGETIEEYSIRVAETWKLGQKEKDNGVLLLVAVEDRKLRIEVGDGLEGTLTDALCSRIIRHEIVPHFKNGDFDRGIQAGVDAILGVIEGTYSASEDEEKPDPGAALVGGFMFLFVVGAASFLALFAPGSIGWFLYLFLMPFWLAFPMALLGGLPWGGLPFALFLITFPILRLMVQSKAKSPGWQQRWVESFGRTSYGGWSSGGWSSRGGGFSGGGGGFSGGGSSGSW